MTKYLEYGKCLETGETAKSFEYRNNDFCDRHTDTQTAPITYKSPSLSSTPSNLPIFQPSDLLIFQPFPKDSV